MDFACEIELVGLVDVGEGLCVWKDLREEILVSRWFNHNLLLNEFGFRWN